MLRITGNEVQAIIRQLDQALYNHMQWHGTLNRTLICRLPYDERDVVEDAHRRCLFGQWYYNQAPQRLRDHPAFVAMEAEHRRMHELAARLLHVAAADTPLTGFDYDAFANSLERLRLQIQTLKRELEDALYNRDALTGANARIGMLTRLREQQELVKRGVHSCAIAMMDLDHFKDINDRLGHSAGDQVLAAAVGCVVNSIRPYDSVFRYGGEEFLICAPNADLTSGHTLAERLRQRLAATAIKVVGKEVVHVTASFGLTLLAPDIPVEESVDRADKAMYAAKSAGRNCTRAWESGM
jgi:diguanylate cyclase